MTEIAQRQILVVDDDERIRTLLSWQLEAEGFGVRCAADGAEALEHIGRVLPDLVILDLSLPGMAGLDVLRWLRCQPDPAQGPSLPVIILSGRSGETDRILGLDLGADDYLVKPFSPGELAARARSVLRRAPGSGPAGPPPAAIEVNPATREAFVYGQRVDLTAREFDLLAFLVHNPRQVFTRTQLLRSVWHNTVGWQTEATVTEHVHRLRGKLGDDRVHPRWLRTVRGVGYRLEP
jgi:two-component system, OmpR family, phosphate regulon response regulator PhoB